MNRRITHIPDVMMWLRLQTTKVSGLSFRGWLKPSDVMYTSNGEVTTPDHLEYIRSLSLGAKEIRVLNGEHPVEAVMNSASAMADLAESVLAGDRISFFEIQENGPERRLIELLAKKCGRSTEDIMRQVAGNPVGCSRLGSKLAQRELMKGKDDRVFLPYLEAQKTESGIKNAIHEMVLLTGCNRVLVRVDGEASGDGQAFWPEKYADEILEELDQFEATTVMVEPAVKHIPVSSLLEITRDGAVQFLGSTVQLETEMLTDIGFKRSWTGNWMYSPFNNCLMSEKAADQSRMISLSLGAALASEGVRGKLSNDGLLLREGLPKIGLSAGDLVLTEANLRETNGTYSADAHQQLVRRHHSVSSGNVVFKGCDPTLKGFASLACRFPDMMYNGSQRYGIIPVVTTLLPQQAFMVCFGETPDQFEEVVAEAWKRMRCPGSTPAVSHRNPVAQV